MSNIAIPSRTDEPVLDQLAGVIRALLGAVLLSALFVTLTPYTTSFEGEQDAGSLVNQVGYSLMAGIALLGHLVFTGRDVALSLLRPAWLLIALWLLVTATYAIDPENALRAVAFTLLAMLAMTGALCLPKDAAAFRFGLTAAALVVLGMSYFGVLFMPEEAIHGSGGHAGLWRGVYSHKNVAGAVMASLFFCGLYLMRCRQVVTGGALALLSAFFVLQTGSKTALGLLPVVALLVLSSRFLGGPRFMIFLLSLALIGIALFTLGTVLFQPLDALLQMVAPGTTFTGRTDLWRFSLELLEARPWTGFGFESFWSTPIVDGTEPSMELSWDPRGSANAHNGFLDMAIAMGWPGLFLAVFVVAVLPFRDFIRSGSKGIESSRMADLFIMILAFLLMDAFLESFLFARANPIWMMMWFAIAGLRLLARNRLDPGKA